MAMTATISLSPTTALINQPVTATLTVSNSSGSPVNVTSVAPQAQATGSSAVDNNTAVAFSVVGLGQGQTSTVPASGSLIFTFQTIFFAPSTGPIGAGSGTYSVGALVSSNDGSNFAPTAATVTVNPLPLPLAQQ